jgi:hypothetical protein
MPRPSSRASNRRFVQASSWRATIDRMAAKLSWKLGPAADSGQSSMQSSAPAATMRSVIASRPSASPASTTSAAIRERTVGTSAPVSIV